MGLSDVKVITISDEVALDADGISTATSVGNNAALTIGGALHSGGTVTNASGRQVTILSAGNDSSKSFTVVGTDVNGDVLTETVTGADTGTATSSGFFKTITSITAVGNPAGNVSAGINNSAADVIFAGRVRLKGFSIVSGGSAGTIEFKNTSPAGTTLFKAKTIGTDNTTIDRTIPAEGVLFDAGMYVTYTVGTIDMMTFFYA